MKFRYLPVVAAITVAACSKAVPSDGYKDLKYWMTLDQLANAGFKCSSDDICHSDEGKRSDTLFGKEARVSVDTKDGRLTSISATVQMTEDELIDLLSKQFGRPETFDYSSYGGGIATKAYWLSNNGTAIAVTKTKIEGVLTPKLPSWMPRTPLASADYLGPEETADLLKQAKGNKVDPSDT